MFSCASQQGKAHGPAALERGWAFLWSLWGLAQCHLPLEWHSLSGLLGCHAQLTFHTSQAHWWSHFPGGPVTTHPPFWSMLTCASRESDGSCHCYLGTHPFRKCWQMVLNWQPWKKKSPFSNVLLVFIVHATVMSWQGQGPPPLDVSSL